jgi:pyruvate,water dikinase
VSQFRRLLPLTSSQPADCAGAKAARLSAALQAGFPVLPGWVLPVAASRPAVRAAAAEIRADGIGGGRRAALSQPVEPALVRELEAAVALLGGRVIVRSSSPLEADPRWSGAFTSVAEVGQTDVATAVRSCWAGALAPDPLRRLELCGLPLEAAKLAVLLQPEINPESGGLARVACPQDGDVEVTIESVDGHPGALLSGLVDGVTTRLGVNAADLAEAGSQVALAGSDLTRAVARLALGVYRGLGDDVIEWAAWRGEVWLFQSLRHQLDARAAELRREPAGSMPPVQHASPAEGKVPRESMLTLAETVCAHGQRVPARPAAPGAAAGRLIACRQHEAAPPECRDAVLLVERALPRYAPLLFAARGVIAGSGSAGSHLAGVARSLGVPMVVGCPVEAVTGADPAAGQWLAAMDGGTGDVAVLKGGSIGSAR